MLGQITQASRILLWRRKGSATLIIYIQNSIEFDSSEANITIAHFCRQIIVVVGIDHLLTKYAYFITSKNDTTETIQEQEGIRPLSGGAPSLDHYSDTTLGASPHHSPPKSSSAWHEDGNILNTGGVQYSDANSSMGNLSDYHQQGASPDENTGEPRKIVVLG